MKDTDAMAAVCAGLLVLTGIAYYFHSRTRAGRTEVTGLWRLVTPWR